MSTRRQSLAGIKSSHTKQAGVWQAEHAGLWLDKFIAEQERTKTEVRSNLVKEVAGIAVPDCYTSFYKRWKKILDENDPEKSGYVVKSGEAKVLGRMVLGTGNESVLETAVTLHRTYGVPYIPGSALKGLTANFARHFCGDRWEENSNAYQTVFGLTDESGCITFFDALYVPNEENPGKPLR